MASFAEAVRYLVIELEDLLEYHVLAQGAERWQASDHLVDYAAEGPEVGGSARCLVGKELWRHVLGGTDKRTSAISPILLLVLLLRIVRPRLYRLRVLEDLRAAKVCDEHVHLLVQQDVLWLEIAMDDAEAVKVLKAVQDLRRVELGALDVERADLVDVGQ